MKHRNPSAVGFTLIEMLIVIVCLGIIAALVLPKSTHGDKARLRSAAQILVTDIEYVQFDAIGNGANRNLIVFDVMGHRYYVARESESNVPIEIGGRPYETVFGHGHAAVFEGVWFEHLELDGEEGNQLAFSILGTLSQAADAQIVLRCGDATLQITIDSDTGDITIE